MLTTEERKEKLRNFSGKDLVDCFIWHHNNFNPIDEDLCESYELVKEELIRRCERKE